MLQMHQPSYVARSTVALIITLFSVFSAPVHADTKLSVRYRNTLRGGVVVDAWGVRSTENAFKSGTLYVRIPRGATVVAAYLVSGVTDTGPMVSAGTPQRQVIIGSGASKITVPLEGMPDDTVTGSAGPVYMSFVTDVTTAIGALTGSAAADGTISVPIQERGDAQVAGVPTLPLILGHSLAVVYSFADSPFRNVSIYMGASGNTSTDGSTSLNDTLFKSVAKFCGSEGLYPASLTVFGESAGNAGEESGVLTVNGMANVLSSAVGLSDDDADKETDGALSIAAAVTAGSFGARQGAPGIPSGSPTTLTQKLDEFATVAAGRMDDELYDFKPFINDKSSTVAMTYTAMSGSFLGAWVLQTLARYSITDADNDGIGDNDPREGCADNDGDGLPNYIDANSAPTAVDNTIRVVLNASASVPFSTFTANDTDADNDPLTITAVSNSSSGLTVNVNTAGKTLDLSTPPTGTSGSFTYTVDDGKGATDTATVTVYFVDVAISSPLDSDVLGTGTPTFMGTSSPGQTVSLAIKKGNTTVNLSTTTNNAGVWSTTVPVGMKLADGNYMVTATAADLYGSQATSTISVTIATSASADGDSVLDQFDADDDNDGIPDSEESPMGTDRDTDGDGIADRVDLDSDNDGIPDVVEAGFAQYDADHNGRVDIATGGDVDNDGWDDRIDTNRGGVWTSSAVLINTDGGVNPDYVDVDSDNDGVPDVVEAGLRALDANKDTRVDNVGALGMDSDANDDGWHDSASALGNVAMLPNSDTPSGGSADATPDYRDLDSDDDNVADNVEAFDGDHNGQPDAVALGMDSDGDGLDNAFDPNNGGVMAAGTYAPLPDTDGDTKLDMVDVDDDNDTLLTKFEDPMHNAMGDPRMLDDDSDGRPNYVDSDDDGDGALTSSESPDPNGDGSPADAGNTFTGDNPDVPDYLDKTTSPIDSDGDGISDSTELRLGLKSDTPDSDGDGLCDGDVAIPGTCFAAEHAASQIDSDMDGVIDALDVDDDNDTSPTRDEDENANGNPADDDSDADGIANYLDVDDDGDGILTADEIAASTKVGSTDIDLDGLKNWNDGDANGDGIADALQDPNADLDGDGFPDWTEPSAGGLAGGASSFKGCAIGIGRHSLGSEGWAYLIFIAAYALWARRGFKGRAGL